MANGTIRQGVVFPSSGSFKLPNGIIVAWGTITVQTSTQSSSAIFPYRGSSGVDISSSGISNIICAFANVVDAAGYWNAAVSSIDGSWLNMTVGGNSNALKTAWWLAIGT